MTDFLDEGRVLGIDALIADLRQFRKLEALGLSNSDIAHRMASSVEEVVKLRNTIGRGQHRLAYLPLPLRVKVLLGSHGITTLNGLLNHTDKELLAFRGLGPKTLVLIKQVICNFVGE